MAIRSLRFLSVINNLSDLIAAFKAWWHAPIKIELKKKEPEAMTPEEFKKLPQSVLDILNIDTMAKYRKQYYDDIRARLRANEFVSAEERYRLRMHDHINQINDVLEHPDDGGINNG